jgi:aconitate hydratase
VVFPAGVTRESLTLTASSQFDLSLPEGLAPNAPVEVRVLQGEGAPSTFTARLAIATESEIAALRAGGILPLIMQRLLAAGPVSHRRIAP